MAQILLVAATLAQGSAAKKSADEEASNIRKQAGLQLEESRVEAERVGENFRKFQIKQKLSFLKSGVSLEGSPLLVLADTAEESKRQTDAILNRGTALAGLGRSRAKIAERGGRAKLLSSVFTAGGQSGLF